MMKMKIVALCVMMAGVLSAMSHAAPTLTTFGGTGKIHFKGGVTDGACGIDLSSINQDISLPVVKMANLKKNAVATGTPFAIKLTDCDPHMFPAVKASFTGLTDISHGAPADTFAPVTTATSAKNVGLQITDFHGSVLTPGLKSTALPLAVGDNEMSFTANYKAGTDDATPGDFDATVNFSLEYQ